MVPTPRMPALAAALLLALYPAGALLAQDDGGMKKDHDAMHDAGMMDKMGPPAEGTFTGANGNKAAGTVHVLDAKGKRQLHFTADFTADKAPDTYVMLSEGPTPVEGASTTVAKLTRFKGEQTFDLPAGTDPGRYRHLVLWSKKKGQAIAHAELHAPGMKMDDAMGKKDGMMDKKDGMMDHKDGMMDKKNGMMDKKDEMMENRDTMGGEHGEMEHKGEMEKDGAMDEHSDSM